MHIIFVHLIGTTSLKEENFWWNHKFLVFGLNLHESIQIQLKYKISFLYLKYGQFSIHFHSLHVIN